MALSAKDAAQRAGKGETVIGWKLDRDERDALLQRFPPKFAQAVADHVTLAAKVAKEAELPGETEGEIVGWIDDNQGVEAMVVRIGGTTDRPDGSIYHITWSLAQGRKAKESNDVIRRLGWRTFDQPIPVRLQPARF